MSTRLIARSRDLKRLQDEGYEIAVRSGYLIVTAVPYVTPQKAVGYGTVVTDLTLNDDVTQKPGDHQVWFAGSQPCHADGSILAAIGAQPCNQAICEGVNVDFRFSSKPPEGYPDYHAKIVQYVRMLSHPARSIDPAVTAQTYRPIGAADEESVFLYADSASSRAGIVPASEKLAMKKVAIIGLGGTGSYVLDLVAKTGVREIHLFDGDRFVQHNAFRAPGAASLDDLKKHYQKVVYYRERYSQMRRGIIAQDEFVTPDTLGHLVGFDFVFVCVDRPAVRRIVSEFLHAHETPFIDVGMELQLIEEDAALIGSCRVSLSTPSKREHFSKHVSLGGDIGDELYGSNIQVADLNALNAALAVIKWKKYCAFYQDCYREHQSVYAINAHQLTRDETDGV